MSIFAIGDTHLSLTADKPMDAFFGWQNYTERIKSNWEKVVKENDTVVIVGDISWATNYAQAIEDFKFLESLPGTKVLIKGNHDYWWETASKNNKFLAENGFKSINFVFNNCYVAEGFAICGTRSWAYDAEDDGGLVLNREIGRLNRSVECAKQSGYEPILFLHYPPITKTGKCDKVYDAVIESGVKECYYAHLHGFSIPTGFNGESDGVKFKLVSADSLDFMPYLVRKSDF